MKVEALEVDLWRLKKKPRLGISLDTDDDNKDDKYSYASCRGWICLLAANCPEGLHNLRNAALRQTT